MVKPNGSGSRRNGRGGQAKGLRAAKSDAPRPPRPRGRASTSATASSASGRPKRSPPRDVAPTPPGGDDERATRERILAAAHRVFLRQGTAKARTQEIADEAGVNKALVHYYFGTKDALSQAVFESVAVHFMPRIFAIVASETLSIEDKARGIIREQVEIHLTRPYLAPYMVAEAHADPERVQGMLRRAGPAPIAVLRRQLAEAAAQGTIRRISAEQFIVSLVALVVFPFLVRPMLAVIVGLDDTRFQAFMETRKRELLDFFLAGLRP